MAKMIHVSRPITLGNGALVRELKPGIHRLEDEEFDKWYIRSLIQSGDIIVKGDAPEEPTNLAEVVIDDTGFVQNQDEVGDFPADEENDQQGEETIFIRKPVARSTRPVRESAIKPTAKSKLNRGK